MIQKNSTPYLRMQQLSVLSLSALLTFSTAHSNPVNPTVVHGDVTFMESGSVMEIMNSPGAIINWQGFSIDKGELTRFIQQNDMSAVLNRVTGADISTILGDLQSNGRVFLINPNGIVFGESAVIDTNGFVASTLDMSDQDFIQGIMRFRGDGGAIENRGLIHVKGNGDIALLAPDVENSGILKTESGEILLAAGRDIEISSAGVDGVTFNVQAPGDRAVNLGQMIADRGALGVFADSVSNRGEMRVVQKGGRIFLEGNSVEVSGEVVAPAGDIDILGDNIDITSANISTAAPDGGGDVIIGGELQGGEGVRTAATTTIDAASTIDASALNNGDGGRIIIWSDIETQIAGRLSARGGASGGDGGFIETSSKGLLHFELPADVTAPAGQGGDWLLDPEDIRIGSGQAAGISSALNNGASVTIKTSDGGSGEGNIYVNAPITKTEGPDAALALIAHNKISVNAPITSTSGKLNVTLRAGTHIGIHATIATNGGNLSTGLTGYRPPEEEEEEESEEQAEVAETSEESPAEDGNADTQAAQEESVSQEAEEAVADAADSTDAAVGTTPEVAPAPELADVVDAVATEAAPDLDVDIAVPEAPAVDSAPVDAIPIDVVAEVADNVATEIIESTVDSVPTLDPDLTGIDITAEVVSRGGRIEIDAGGDARSTLSGILDSSNDVAGATGGDIQLLGNEVFLTENASIDSSGDAGGGDILIGGDYQGANDQVRNAQTSFIGGDVTINSSAVTNGDAGRTIIWADDSTHYYGSIEARGGAEGGDGGFVEVSGKQNLAFDGAVDVSAPQGEGGSVLLDPQNVFITDFDNTDGAEIVDGQILAGDGGAATFTITGAAVAAVLGGDVDIAATDNITVDGAVNWASTSTLTLVAQTGQINVNDTLNGGANGDIDLQSGGDTNLNATGQILGDNLTVASNSDFNVATGATINVTTLDVTTSGGINSNSSTVTVTNNASLDAGSNIAMADSTNNFGTLTVQANNGNPGSLTVAIAEASDTEFAGSTFVNGRLVVESSGSISDGGSASVNVPFQFGFSASGNVNLDNPNNEFAVVAGDAFGTGDITIADVDSVFGNIVAGEVDSFIGITSFNGDITLISTDVNVLGPGDGGITANNGFVSLQQRDINQRIDLSNSG
ncbi:MAG: filamentous hemagglutinin N-terminal domain-containing protein, partial [Pseudomonadota bacterium]